MKKTDKKTAMRGLLFGILLSVLALGLTGCLGGSEDVPNDLTFKNLSSHTVSVISLTTEWGSFSLPPGQTMYLTDIDNVDYYFEPSTRVREGSESTDREVIFVNAPPSGKSVK